MLSSSRGLVAAPVDIRKLNSMAVRGLASMFDESASLFCHRLIDTKQGLRREGLSPRYTVMTLLGLYELRRSGASISFDIEALFESFVRETHWISGVGDLGLTIWLIATIAPDRLGDFFGQVHLDTVLDRCADARQARTMELAWFLAGLAHAASTSPQIATELTDLAVEAYRRLEENQTEHGLFGHLAKGKSLAGVLRGRIGSFADQIYPIYAISKFATAFGAEEPLDSALQCAFAVCGAQGPLGQWYWLYDSSTGRISSQYPVYSVHQHGMAPMALFALEMATGQNFQDAIFKGLDWINGSNEMGIDMRDTERNLIWRCIRPENQGTKYWNTVLSLVRNPKETAPTGGLTLLREDRPYELGWLLYAFGKFGAAED
jgi:hypothetical protein